MASEIADQITLVSALIPLLNHIKFRVKSIILTPQSSPSSLLQSQGPFWSLNECALSCLCTLSFPSKLLLTAQAFRVMCLLRKEQSHDSRHYMVCSSTVYSHSSFCLSSRRCSHLDCSLDALFSTHPYALWELDACLLCLLNVSMLSAEKNVTHALSHIFLQERLRPFVSP